jgi:hypothetical protein
MTIQKTNITLDNIKGIATAVAAEAAVLAAPATALEDDFVTSG